jgi:hypothetical protein
MCISYSNYLIYARKKINFHNILIHIFILYILNYISTLKIFYFFQNFCIHKLSRTNQINYILRILY